MAGNIYDDTLEQLPAAPAAVKSPYDDVIQAQDAGQQQQLRTSLVQADATTPERAADVQKLSTATGIPAEIVDREYDTIRQRAKFTTTPYRDIVQQTPALAAWASQPANAAVAKDDFENLGALDWLVNAPTRAFTQGMNSTRYALLRAESITRDLTASEQQQLALYKAASEDNGQLGAGNSWFRGAVTGLMKNLPMLFGAGLAANQYGMAGAAEVGAAGALAGSVLPGAGTAAGFMTGAGTGYAAGALYGGFEFARKLAAGQAYDEFSNFKDELGRPLDPTVAKVAAQATGYINGALMTGGFKLLAETVPGADKLAGLLTTSAVKQALLQPTLRAAFVEAAKTFGGTLTLETSNMVVQRAAQILIGDVAKGQSGQPFVNRDAGETAADLGQTAVGALRDFALLTAAGPAAGFAGERLRAQEAIHNATFFQALGEGVAQSKTAQRLPEALQSMLASATKDGPVDTVYAPVASWSTYWQSKGVDPAEMATTVTGDPQAYDRATRTGEDLAIPTAKYATTLAATEHNAFFANELRLAPEHMNAREGQAFAEKIAADQQAEAESAKALAVHEAAAPVRDAITERLVASGTERSAAEAQAQLWQSVIGTLGERSGVDPVDLFSRYGLTIERPELAPEVQAGETTLTQDNPFAARAASARARADRLSAPTAHEQGMADAFPLGPGFGRAGSGDRIDASIDRAVVAERARREADFYERRATAFDAGTIDASGRARDAESDARSAQRSTAKEKRETRIAAARAERGDRPAWEVPAATWADAAGHLGGRPRELMMQDHQEAVRKAVTEGQFVPDDVLADYPALQATATTLFQSSTDSRRTQLEERIQAAREGGHEDLQAVAELRDLRDTAPAPTSASEDGTAAPAPTLDARFDPSSPDFLRQGERGYIRISADRQLTIGLLKGADLSTFLHESGHGFLEIMRDLAKEPGAESIRADLAALEEHLFAGAGSETEKHERFARGFEAYLMEGKAPSAELQPVFARFRAWLLGIYRSLKGLNVELTPEVRGVFDRLVASDVAIEQTQAEGHVSPLFTDAAMAGMTPEAFDAYRATVQAASDQAKEELSAKLLKDLTREQQTWWKAERETTRAGVAAAAEQEPIFRALAAIQKGTHPDGRSLVEGKEPEPLKLAKSELVGHYTPEELTALRRRHLYAADGGTSPEVVAQLTGFSSGDALVRALLAAPSMKSAIERATDERMIAKHGDLMRNGQQLAEEAKAAVFGEGREKVIRAELRALATARRIAEPVAAISEAALKHEQRERAYERRWFEAEAKLRIAIAEGHKQVEIDALKDEVHDLKAKARGGAATIRAAIPPAAAINDYAERRLAEARVRDLRPSTFLAAAQRSSRLAVETAARQQLDDAISHKQRELINLALYREAVRQIDRAESARQYLGPHFDSASVRERIGKAGADYLERIDDIRQRYDFTRQTLKTIDARTSLLRWAEAKAASTGLPLDLPDELLNEARRGNYKDLTVEELQGVRDGVRMIEHLATLKNKLLKVQAGRELAAAADTIVTSIGDHSKGPRETGLETRLPGSATSKNIATFFASHRKLSSLLREMDGFQDGGTLWESVMRPLNEAADHEAVRNEQATIALRGIFDAYKGEETTLYHSTEIPAIGDSLTKMGRLMVALNWGNEGNRARVRDGYHWSDEQVGAILNTLDARDWHFVQGVWDHINSYWGDIAAKERRVTGVEPEKVLATPVQTAFGEMPGGYFPIKYEHELSARAGANLEAGFAEGVKQAAYVRATTQRGHTEARAAKVSEPVRLDFGVITEHVQQVIHDLTHHETLLDVGRLLAHRDVQDAIYKHYGPVAYDQIKGAVRDIAFGNTPAPGWYKTLNAIRAKTVTATLGWNAVTSLLHTLQLTRGMVRVGPGYVLHGLGRWLSSAKNAEGSVGWIEAQSDMMRLRWKTQQRELNEVRNTVGLDRGKVSATIHDTLAKAGVDPGAMPAIADSYFYAIRRIVQFAEIPTWIGGYEKAMADPANDHARAVALANQAVEDSMGSGHIKDLAAVQRAPMGKLLTTFYDYHNAVYQQAYELVKNSDAPGRKLMDASLLLFVPVAFGAALHHMTSTSAPTAKTPSPARELTGDAVDYGLNMFVGLRELSGFMTGRDYTGPAGLRFVDTFRKFGYRASEGDLGSGTAKAANDVGGELFGYPARQVERTATGIQALWTGKTKDLSAVVFGGPKEHTR